MKILRLGAAFLLATSFLVACKKDKHDEHEHDHEMITSIELTFKETGTAQITSFKWEDLDGQGGNPPVIETVNLLPGKTYDVSIKISNPSGEDITAEIKEHADTEHRFYYIATAANVTINGLDNDSKGLPLGLTSKWTTAAAGDNNVRVVLRHYGSSGKAADDAVDSPKSSTDIDATFPVKVQ